MIRTLSALAVMAAAGTLAACSSGSGGSYGSASERAGMGDYDASGQIPCVQYAGQPMRQCDFRVTREGGGNATIIVTRPDGAERALFFENGRFLSADTSQADGYPEYSASRSGDMSIVRVGEERYEVPDAVIFGG